MRTLLRAPRCRPRHDAVCLFSLALALVGMWHPSAYGAPINAAAKTAQKEFHPADMQLKNVHDAARRLRSAALMLVNDVEQRDMVVTGEPMIIQPIPMKDDKQAIGWAQQMEDLGPALPPRKKWLDVDMSSTGQLVALIQDEIGGIQLPAEKQDRLAAPWGELKALVQDTQSHYTNLQGMTNGPTYDNVKIGQEALAIYDDMGKLEKPLKQILQILRTRS